MLENTPFISGSMNDTIFRTSAPYNNKYQGLQPRWLFVCSAGLLRSPTGATMAAQRGINARSCGSAISYALVPCTANLLAWADKIICVSSENYYELEANFQDHPTLIQVLEAKATVLDIPDNFVYMDQQLQQHFVDQLFLQ